MEQVQRLQSIEREMLSEGRSSSDIDAFKARLRQQSFTGENPQFSGVGALNETARDMNRGPRGIAVYMQDGGEAEGYAAEGKKFADDFGPVSNVTAKDAVKFVAEMTPILGDAMAAKDLWAEATSENPNWGYITALGGITAIGLIPGAGPLLAKGLKAGAKNVFNVGKNISEKMPKYDPNVLGSMGGNLFGEGTPDFAADFLTENLKKKIPEQKIDEIILDGKTSNLSTEEINKQVLDEARQLKVPFPKRAFDNPKVEYVNTDLINELIPRGNPIRYQPGTFNREGGQYYSPMSDEIDEFLESGKPTLKEDIYNEGFKEPLMIHVSKETGEVLLGEGHHRLHTALQLGIDEVPVYVNMKEKLPRTDFQSPIIIDTKDLKNYTNYSFKEIDFKNRIKRRRVTPEESYRDDMERLTGNYQYNIQNPDGERVFLNQNKPLMNERNNPPMREGYYRKTDGMAQGGEVMDGIGSLNETARNMSRGPRGIAGYQQFADGGPVYMANGGSPAASMIQRPMQTSQQPMREDLVDSFMRFPPMPPQDMPPSNLRGDGMSANDLQRMLSRQNIAQENVADVQSDIQNLQQADVARRAAARRAEQEREVTNPTPIVYEPIRERPPNFPFPFPFPFPYRSDQDQTPDSPFSPFQNPLGVPQQPMQQPQVSPFNNPFGVPQISGGLGGFLGQQGANTGSAQPTANVLF